MKHDDDTPVYGKLFIRANREIMNDAIALYIGEYNALGEVGAVARPLIFEKMDRTQMTYPNDPAMSISMKDAQRLMDELWHCGLRPSEGSGSAGSLRATEKHLDDMRKIAFTKLKVPIEGK